MWSLSKRAGLWILAVVPFVGVACSEFDLGSGGPMPEPKERGRRVVAAPRGGPEVREVRRPDGIVKCGMKVVPGETAVFDSHADPSPERVIDLAICLDTSNSMDGLIDSARMKLWQIVTELSQARPIPRLRVAVLAYGTPSYGAHTGWVRVESDLTDDLDTVYEKLMSLRTNGGTEYVARVTSYAVNELSWDDRNDTLRMIFVAGNESADQDPQIRTAGVARTAATRNVIVNTIYCGREGNSDSAGYRRFASLAHGRFAAIDQSSGVRTVNTPYDGDLARLSGELNGTYLAYGARGAEKAANQRRQDANAATLAPSVAAERARAKSSRLYRNHSWDIVDALIEKKGFKLEDLEADELPAEMREMSNEEAEVFVKETAKRRSEIQSEIKRITRLRSEHVAKEKADRAPGEGSFDTAVRAAVREQAEAAGYAF